MHLKVSQLEDVVMSLTPTFIQLLKLRSEDDRRIINWLGKKTDKYTASDIQNEILKVMSRIVSREIAAELQSVLFLTVMVAETTDVSNKEQMVICFRWMDKKLEAQLASVKWSQLESECCIQYYVMSY